MYILYLSHKKYVLNNFVFFTQTFKKETFNNDTCNIIFPIPNFYASTAQYM